VLCTDAAPGAQTGPAFELRLGKAPGNGRPTKGWGGGVKGGTFGQGYRPVTIIRGLLESPLYVNSLYALVPCKPGYVSYH